MTPFAVDVAKWGEMTIFEQMGNIYSEVGRSFNAIRKNNLEDRDFAVVRAIDLFDATVVGLVKIKSPKTKEVLRAKDQFLTHVYDPHSTEDQRRSLEQYFLYFAIAARSNR